MHPAWRHLYVFKVVLDECIVRSEIYALYYQEECKFLAQVTAIDVISLEKI